jgi:hypothetical protein
MFLFKSRAEARPLLQPDADRASTSSSTNHCPTQRIQSIHVAPASHIAAGAQ